MANAWHLKSRPQGTPTADNFEFKPIPDAPLEDGQVRIRNSWISVDPYMRGRMNDVKSYVPPFQIGEPLQGGAVGEVIESRNPDYKVGDKLLHMGGWRDEAVIGGEMMPFKLPDLGVSDDSWLHTLGLTGATAYFGLMKAASAKEGDIVFVSAAAGAVGSAVVQIAKLKGMTVIGSAGGAEKCAWVKELGADACIDYKAGDVLKQLSAAAPKGIDVYFDNVGGEHLDAAFATARQNARFAICGMIEGYNDGRATELRYFIRTIPARIRIQGFIYTDYLAEMPGFIGEMAGWVKSGKVTAKTTVVDGVDKTLDAFLGLFTGANTGKMLVKV